MKKGINIVTIVLSVVAIILSGYVLLTVNNRKISIVFNTNSERKLDSLIISKGESINLPTLEEDGYEFLGWYIDNEKINNNYKFDKNTILNAKWEKAEELNYELIIYCTDGFSCVNEEYFEKQSLKDIQLAFNKDAFNKYVIKTKTPNAEFFKSVSNYALYEDENLKVYNLKEKKTINSHLNTNPNAKYKTVANNFVLFKDNYMKLYDVDTMKVINDKIDIDTNLENYELYLSEDGTKIIGIGYVKNGYIEYYNVLKNKKLYSNKYPVLDTNVLFYLVRVNDSHLSFLNNGDPDDEAILLSSEEEKELLSVKTNSFSHFKSYGKDGKYIYVIEYGNNTEGISGYFRVYGNNLKPLYEGHGFKLRDYDYSHNKYINIGDYIYILDGNVVKKFDYNGNLISTSKEYSNPLGLINRLERGSSFDVYKMSNNYIVYVKDGNLTIENTDNEKESKVITKWKNKMGVGLLSHYTYAEANNNAKSGTVYEEGIYVSVSEYPEEDMSCDPTIVTEYCYTNNKEIKAYPSYTRATCVAAKPLIYLYPEKEMNVEVKLGKEELLTTVYPKYYNGWNVKAYPNGKLVDKNTGRELYGLYWEGKNYQAKVTNEGFVVKGSDTAEFLEEKLAILGLTEREAEEFIIYWLPQMEHNEFNYIRFATKEEIDEYMPLEINPKPDSVIRVLMEFTPLDNAIKVEEQKLTKANRNGFTVVEWGGSIIKSQTVK